MIGDKLKYYKWKDKVYKLVMRNGQYFAEEWDEKHGMFFPATFTVRPYDIQMLGVEMNPEELLRILR